MDGQPRIGAEINRGAAAVQYVRLQGAAIVTQRREHHVHIIPPVSQAAGVVAREIETAGDGATAISTERAVRHNRVRERR